MMVNSFLLLSFVICRDAESNCGHEDFQSSALPTELSRHGSKNLITFQIVPVKMKFAICLMCRPGQDPDHQDQVSFRHQRLCQEFPYQG
jgi:hypothetical protein